MVTDIATEDERAKDLDRVNVMGWLWWLFAAVAVFVAFRVSVAWFGRAQSAQQCERKRCADIAARADQQHAWTLAADTRGTYGEFPAVQLHNGGMSFGSESSDW